MTTFQRGNMLLVDRRSLDEAAWYRVLQAWPNGTLVIQPDAEYVPVEPVEPEPESRYDKQGYDENGEDQDGRPDYAGTGEHSGCEPCRASGGGNGGYVCTRHVGHDGPHVARWTDADGNGGERCCDPWGGRQEDLTVDPSGKKTEWV